MNFADISPFVRFAYKVALKPNRPTVARDMRFFYVIDGEGTILFNDVPYHFFPGTVMVWQAGTRYTVKANRSLSIISINFDYTSKNCDRTEPYPVLYGDISVDEQFEAVFFEDCPVFNQPIVCTGNSQIYTLLEKLLYEKTASLPYFRERISALLKECLALVARSVSLKNDMRRDSALDKVMDYIHKNYNKEIDNTTLAALVGYHPYYLNKLFLSLNGVTLHKYLTNYRISVSEQLLLSSNASINDIAINVGFSCALSFSSSFKKKNGLTPTEFRKRFS